MLKRWRCVPCFEREAEEAEWEDFRTTGFCRNCGQEATRVFEYGCFLCDDNGMRFWAEEAPHHPCPECGSPSYRIVYAPYLSNTEKRGDYEAADKMLEHEMSAQRASLTSMRKEPAESKLPSDLQGLARDPAFRPFWTGTQDAKKTAEKGVSGSKLPFGMPRPQVTIAGQFDDKRVWAKAKA